MKITFLGHASFRIEIADQTLLIDPWVTGNRLLAENQHQAAVTGATHILLTHAHSDHMSDVVRLSKHLNVPSDALYQPSWHMHRLPSLYSPSWQPRHFVRLTSGC